MRAAVLDVEVALRGDLIDEIDGIARVARLSRKEVIERILDDAMSDFEEIVDLEQGGEGDESDDDVRNRLSPGTGTTNGTHGVRLPAVLAVED